MGLTSSQRGLEVSPSPEALRSPQMMNVEFVAVRIPEIGGVKAVVGSLSRFSLIPRTKREGLVIDLVDLVTAVGGKSDHDPVADGCRQAVKGT